MKREGKEAIKLPCRVTTVADGGTPRFVADARHRLIADCNNPEEARQIVTALNSYERMRTALEKCDKLAKELKQQRANTKANAMMKAVAVSFLKITTTALAQEQR